MTQTPGRNASDRNNGKSRNESDSGVDKSQQSQQPAHRVRLPGFITDDEIGLGDAIQRATSYLGIPTCGGCQRRAATLNRWLAFTPRRSK
jgi:hypothetical protein